MTQHLSVPVRAGSSMTDTLRDLPLARLADKDHDTERTLLVGRLIDADRSTARVTVSAFGSSI